jgi:hypothetical protein
MHDTCSTDPKIGKYSIPRDHAPGRPATGMPHYGMPLLISPQSRVTIMEK